MPKGTHWVVGWNMSGYLPEVDPLHGVELDEAVDYLKDELERAGDHEAATDGDAEAFDRARQRVNGWHLGDMRARAGLHGAEENWVCAGALTYWVRVCCVEGCEAINTEGE